MARIQTNLRLDEGGRGRIDGLARQFDVTRTDVIRVAIAIAFRHLDEFRTALRQHQETR